MVKSAMKIAAPTSTQAAPHLPSRLVNGWVGVPERVINPPAHASTPRMVPRWTPA
jgi:hypothetical protein